MKHSFLIILATFFSTSALATEETDISCHWGGEIYSAYNLDRVVPGETYLDGGYDFERQYYVGGGHLIEIGPILEEVKRVGFDCGKKIYPGKMRFKKLVYGSTYSYQEIWTICREYICLKD